MKIPHSKPTISEDDVYAVASNLQSGQIASGREAELFVNEMSQYTGMLGGVAANSGTNALFLALKALDVKPGDEVILPSYVCASVLSAVNYTGANPVLADIELNGYNIDPVLVNEKISGKTKAVIVPHMFGSPAKIERILGFGVPVVEDCAQSVGAGYRGKKLGSFGDVSIFSFYATKMMTTGHGGMALTDSPELLERLEDLTQYDERKCYDISYNYSLTDFQAALGRNQLKKLDLFVERRKEIAAVYDETFETIGHEGRKNKDGICFRYVVEVDEPSHYIWKLGNCGVNCARPVFRPLHRYLDGYFESDFPLSERAMDHAISIPIYPSLNDGEIENVCKAIAAVWDENAHQGTGLHNQ